MDHYRYHCQKRALPKSRIAGSILAILTLGILLNACERISPEARRQALHLPPAGFKGDAQQGLLLFQEYCLACHGKNGRGTNQGPPLAHKIYRPSHHADLSFHMAVRDGVQSHHWSFGEMIPVSAISPEETEHVIAYIRQEQKRIGID